MRAQGPPRTRESSPGPGPSPAKVVADGSTAPVEARYGVLPVAAAGVVLPCRSGPLR